jgi:tetratricopeptide (TPR) repeat protein
MPQSILLKIILPAAVIVAGLAAVTGLSGYIEGRRPAMPEGFADSDLTLHGSRLKGFAFGAEGLVADWYFMRSLQYIGDKILERKGEVINIDDLRDLNPRLLHPMLENATDLDPHFIGAYSYGALVLPAIDSDKAIAFAAKGIANNPDEWRLYQYLGYIYWKLGQYEEAAAIYEKGAEINGASPFMRLMSASMKKEGGSRETARAIYREMLADAADEPVRVTATRRLQDLDALDERDAIDRVLTDFKDKNGRCAAAFGEVAGMLMAVKLPGGRTFNIDSARRLVDPTGKPYVLDKVSCRVAGVPENSQAPIR